MISQGRYLLAIESAIAGGSIAILNESEVIAARCGDGSVSRAEDLLPNIASMLKDTGISKHELFRVAVSLGPGSYTGLRVGIATVMGLRRGLHIEYVGVPLFDALAGQYPSSLIAVPMGKADICAADSRHLGKHRVMNIEEFVESAQSREVSRIVVHPGFTTQLDAIPDLEILNPNLAAYVGRAALILPASDRLDPIYVQNPRFG